MMLYHYCSNETFKAIIESGNIWLSDISKSNDSTELISEILKQKAKLSSSQTKELDQANSLIEAHDAFIYWAFCMSEEGDLLSQWRGYGDDGRGFSIGFDEGILKESIGKIYSCVDLSFDKMIYDGDSVVDFNSSEDCLKLLVESCIYKNCAFSEEREHRIYAFNPKIDFFSQKMSEQLEYCKDDGDGCLKIGFNANMTSHIELPLSLLGNPIREIIIGPKNKCTEVDVKEFLVSSGNIGELKDKTIKVKKSTIPYI